MASCLLLLLLCFPLSLVCLFSKKNKKLTAPVKKNLAFKILREKRERQRETETETERDHFKASKHLFKIFLFLFLFFENRNHTVQRKIRHNRLIFVFVFLLTQRQIESNTEMI